MPTWMELAVLGPTRGLKQQDLDFLFDKDANTIGALNASSRRHGSFVSTDDFQQGRL